MSWEDSASAAHMRSVPFFPFLPFENRTVGRRSHRQFIAWPYAATQLIGPIPQCDAGLIPPGNASLLPSGSARRISPSLDVGALSAAPVEGWIMNHPNSSQMATGSGNSSLSLSHSSGCRNNKNFTSTHSVLTVTTDS